MDSHIQNSTIPIRVLIRDTENRPGIVDKMQSKKSLIFLHTSKEMLIFALCMKDLRANKQ